MQGTVLHFVLRFILFLLGLRCDKGVAASTDHGTNDTTSTSTTAPSTSLTTKATALEALNSPYSPSSVPTHDKTCQRREVNYVTHTLPQQCLKTSYEGILWTEVTGDATAVGQDVSNTGGVAAGTRMESPSGQTTATVEMLNPDTTPLTATLSASETPSVVVPDPLPSPVEQDADTDSFLEDAKFLSFEEWKKQNLERAGQSPETVGRGSTSGGSANRKRPDISNLDSLGDEGEIDFDFGAFGGLAKEPPLVSGTETKSESPAHGDATEAVPSVNLLRSKDAGKTCKERYNYASFDCAGTVMKTNPQCKSATSVLVENKDSYMLNECAAPNKFVIVELCDHILVDTIVLANFEFFSSTVRTFRISVSDKYPPKPNQWIELGVFEARNTREIQAFLVDGSRVWARYLRVEFLTHYGNEYYCPVSLLRVHGITMMEEYKHEEERARGEAMGEEQGIEEAAGGSEKVITADAVVLQEAALASSTDAASESEAEAESGRLPTTTAHVPAQVVETTTSTEKPSDPSGVPSQRSPSDALPAGNTDQNATQATTASSDRSVEPAANSTETTNETPDPLANVTAARTTSGNTSVQGSTSATSTAVKSADTQHTPKPHASADPAGPANSTTKGFSGDSVASTPNTNTASGKTSQTGVSQDTVKPSVPQPQPPAASPPTQESFFKSINKRLQMLESNATLSLQYIEEQSRILRDAFNKVEKRQLNKTETFLNHLNTTVMEELKIFRTQYDQLWQSTVIELEVHREQYQREILAMSARLTLLADEVIFQKRMAVVQSTLLLMCLGFVLFVRQGSSSLEMPIVQNMQNKSQRWKLGLPLDSPLGSPERPSSPDSGRTRSRMDLRRIFRDSSLRDSDSPDQKRNPSVEISPPTPMDGSPGLSRTLTRENSSELVDEEIIRKSDFGFNSGNSSSPESVSHLRLRRHRSGPATPQGTRDNPLEWDAVPSASGTGTGSGSGSGGVATDDGSSLPMVAMREQPRPLHGAVLADPADAGDEKRSDRVDGELRAQGSGYEVLVAE